MADIRNVNLPAGNDYDDYSRELLIEIVMAQKTKIKELLEIISDLRYKIRSYTELRDTEIKPIIHERQSKRKG